jgi:hypothetical protein
MKVQLTRNLGSNHPLGNLQEGDVHELDTEMAANLIDRKLAEPLGDMHGVSDEEPLTARPKHPLTGVSKKAPKPAGKPEPKSESLDPVSDEIAAKLGTDKLDK